MILPSAINHFQQVITPSDGTSETGESLAIHCDEEKNDCDQQLPIAANASTWNHRPSSCSIVYGETYFLAEVWEPSSDAARQLPKSSTERDFQKKRSHLSDVAQAEIVTIVAQKSH